MVLFDIPTRKVIERWDFSIKHEDDYICNENSEPISNKDVKVVQSEIRNVMRQIISSISFLPAIDNPTTFDVYLHPKEAACKKGVPELWEWKSTCDIDIPNSQAVKLRSFSTGFDLVETEVVYKIVESGKKD
ncbi:hypothetical protein ZHAS_00018162 [Anopheles sinensis]|uniref:HORMA domain-containing protein n=1 Tax=Anopheles sinensis TaxID=74873 RepID=A0A084WIR3_ANOSI|nr:hypothetical protein ZHAS_00018162 [Anopheles sinensis]